MILLLSGVSTNAEEEEIVVFKLTKYNKTKTLRDAVHSLSTLLKKARGPGLHLKCIPLIYAHGLQKSYFLFQNLEDLPSGDRRSTVGTMLMAGQGGRGGGGRYVGLHCLAG